MNKEITKKAIEFISERVRAKTDFNLDLLHAEVFDEGSDHEARVVLRIVNFGRNIVLANYMVCEQSKISFYVSELTDGNVVISQVDFRHKFQAGGNNGWRLFDFNFRYDIGDDTFKKV